MNLENWNLSIGEIVAPFGISGEMKVRLDTDFPERFHGLDKICIRQLNGVSWLAEVKSTRFHKGQILLRLNDIHTIEQVDSLRGSLVQIEPVQAVHLPDDEFYMHDLIGCTVITSEGITVGVLESVMRGVANDVYVVRDGSYEALLPAISQVIKQVDIKEKRILITPMEGLLPERKPVS